MGGKLESLARDDKTRGAPSLDLATEPPRLLPARIFDLPVRLELPSALKEEDQQHTREETCDMRKIRHAATFTRHA